MVRWLALWTCVEGSVLLTREGEGHGSLLFEESREAMFNYMVDPVKNLPQPLTVINEAVTHNKTVGFSTRPLALNAPDFNPAYLASTKAFATLEAIYSDSTYVERAPTCSTLHGESHKVTESLRCLFRHITSHHIMNPSRNVSYHLRTTH